MNAFNVSLSERVNRAAVRAQTQYQNVRPSAGRWSRAVRAFAALAVALLALGGAQAQTIRRITAPGKFYVDDKQSAGIVYNYAVYAISNSTSTNIVSAYVVMTNMIATNLITLASTETGVRSLGALAPGQTKLAAFYLKGPSFTGNSDTLLNTTNETHTIRVYDGLPGFGATLVSSNYAFTNIIFVIEALANKITIITNLNPQAVLGSDVDLVIGGETGTIGGNNSVYFSPGVLGSWRPDAYELVGSIVRFSENGNFTNQMYFDPSISGFTNFSGQAYTNTFRFRAVKVTGTNLPVSPFSFVDSGAGTKHTAVSSLISGGGSNVIYSAANVISIISQSVTPTSLLAPGGTVTYSVTFSNQSTTTVDLNEIRDTLPGFPGNFTYIPGTATFNFAPLADPSISGQLLRWALPLTLPASSAVTLTFQATAPLPAGQYTNSVIGILGNEQIDTTIITTDNSPSLSFFTIIPVSDVAIAKSAPASVYSGAPFNYTITVTNLGPSPATSLSITDSLPANVTFVSASPGAFTNGSQVIWTNFGPVAAGTATNLTITVTPPVVAASLTNSARGFSPVLDPNSTNNTSPPVFTSVTPAADLRITKSASTASVLPGANVTYTITVTNFGASLANSVTVTDTLPASVSFVSASSGGVFGSGKVIWASLGNFAAGTGTSLSLTVTAPLNGGLTNTATASSLTFDTNTLNNVTPPVVTSVSNVPPGLVNDTASVPRNTAVTVPVLANDSDANGNLLTLLGVTQTNGTAVLSSGTNVLYTPSTNFMGTTVLTYTVTDGQGATNSALITISVTNRPPVAVNDSALGTNSIPQVIKPLVNDSDADGDSLTITNVVATGGIVTINAGSTNITYTPTNSFSSTITYTIADGFGGTATATILVIGNNVAPSANNQSVTLPEDTSTNLVVSATDIDSTTLFYALLAGPTHGTLGTLNTNTGAVTYSPSNNFNGADSFTFTVFDGALYATGTVSLTVSPVNDPPVLVDDNITTNEDSTNTIPVLVNDSDADGDPLTIVSVTSTNGTAIIVGTNVVYTPSSNFFGTNVMSYCVTDGTVTNCAAITVVVNPVNDAPTADNQAVTIPEDGSTNLVLTASDVDNTNLTFSILTGPASGGLSPLNTNSGAVTYTPNANYAGSDGFTFRVFDGSLYATGTVSITVTPQNDEPVADSQSVTNLEDTALPITLTGSDVDGPVTNFVLGILPLHGTLSGSGANLTYTPTNNYFGPDSFTFTVNDGSLTSAVATVSITVLSVNDAPVASDDSYSTFKNVPLTISAPGVLGNDTDVESVSLAAILAANVTHGTLSLSTNGGFTYTPSNSYVGPDSFTYRASDGTSNSAVATVSLTVLATNIAPVIVNDSVTMNEDGTNTIPVLVNDSDADGDPLTIVSVVSTNGTAVIVGTNVVYTPSANFSGTNVMTYCVTDGAITNCALITVIVNAVNDAPLAFSQSVTNLEDTALPITLTGADVDGPVTNFVLTTLPLHGSLSGSGANLTYTPTNNYNGPDSFTFTVNDGSLTSLVATVSITVTPINDPPIAVNDSITVNEDSTNNIPVLVNDSDPDGNPLTLVSVSTNATIVGTNVVFTPAPNFSGTNVLNYCITDGFATNCATITVIVLAINDAPLANSQSVTIPEDTSTNLVLTASDVDSTNLTFSIVSGPANGSLGVLNTNTGVVTYSPSNNFNGADSFTFRVFDGSLYATGTVSITVLPINDPPVAVNDSITVNEDSTNSIPVLVNDSDPDGNPLTLVSVSTNATIVGTNVVFTPAPNFSGTNVLNYCITDGFATNCATITVIVLAVNDAPLANSQSVTNLEDTALPITLTGSDVDGPVTNFVLTTLPLHGSLSGSGANLTYTPTNNYNGPDSFTFTVNDGSLTSAVATVSITVLPVNDAPVAVNDSYNVFKNLTLNIGAPGVLSNDTDVESNALSAALVANVTHGTLSLSTNGGFTYTPSNNYVGPDSFTYRASDGVSNSATATVSITVLATNTAPVAVNDGYNVNEDTLLNVLVTGGVLTNDTDVDADTLTATIAVTTTNGILSLNANGSFQYTPNTNFVGVDTFTYRANDALTNSGIATVTITINAVNDAPAATNLSVTMPEDSSTNLVVRGSDVESTNLSYAILASPAHGTLGTMNTNTGAVTYSPSNNFNGADSFTFTVFDGSLYATGTVSITVTPINDPPVAVNDTTVTSEDVAAIMSAASLLANDLDADTDTLTVTSVQSAINGTVSLSGSTVTFTPSLNYNGPASFTYTVSDGNGGTSTATVNITVQPVNDAPVAANDSYSTFKNVPLNVSAPGVLANDTDVDSSLTAVLATNVTHGVLVLNTNGGFTYTPSNNYVGPDSFAYRASDGTATSLAIVSLTIAATNSAPVSVNDSYSVNEDTVLNVPVSGVLTNDTDVDADTLTATVVATTTNGVLSLNANGSFTYTPNTNFNGVDHFTYLAHDAFTNSAVATVTITVNAVNDAPVATNLSVTIPEDSSTNLVVRGSDVESTNLSYAILNNPVHGTLGTLNTNTGAVTYSPSNNFNGADSFTFTVFDGSLYATGTVSITVLPINDPPVAVNDNATVNEDSTNNIPVLVNDTDPDGNPLTIVNVSSTNGTATIVGTNVVYTPSANFNGTNVITYCISDGFVTNCATITVVVLPVNDAPAANNQSVTINEDASTNLVLTASDVDSSFTFSIVSGPTSGSLGTLNTNTGAVTYSPNANYNGGDSFTFRVFDGSLYATGTVSITVLPVNDAPVATNDNYSTPANTALVVAASGVLANDSDVEGNALTAALVANPLHGTLSLSLNGGFTYTPTNDYSGPDSFTYRASDGISNSATATVTITVAALADVAVSKTGPTNVNPGASFSYVITVTNYGPTTASNIVVVDSLPTNLVFSSATGGGSNVSYIVTWPTLPALAKNAGTNFTIFVIAPTNGSFVNVASATATTADPDASNNNGSAGGSRVSSTVVAVQFGVRQGTNVFNPQTGLYEQLVSVTNLSGSTVAAFQVLVGDIRGTNGVSRTNVWLWNATGTNFDGRRYVQYNSPLDPGSNATVRLEFYNPLRTPFTNSIEILATFPTPAVTNLSGGVVVDTYFWDYRAAGDSRFVIEWTSIIGRNYTVIYGPTPTGPWTAATPSVTATATRVQWYDDGPPKTASKPQANVSRYYRVILNP